MLSLRKFIFDTNDDDDVNEVNIRSPSDYRYMIIVRNTLSVINSWPLKEIGLHEPKRFSIALRCLHLTLCLLRIVGGILYMILHHSEMTFFEIGHLYLAFLMDLVILSRVTTLTFQPRYRVVAGEFITKIHLFYYKDSSEYAMETHMKVLRISHRFTLFLLIQMIGGLILFNAIPMYNNYAAGRYKRGGAQNSTFEHSLYYSYPFDTSTKMSGYIFACCAHWMTSYLCATWFCMFDLFLSLMVFHLWGHFNILLHKLKSFPKPAQKSSFFIEGCNVAIHSEIYSENEQINITEKLKECIVYHKEIANFTERMSDVFGPMLFVYYTFHQVSGCLLLLECSQMTTAALMRYLPLTIILFQQLIQLSIIFELIGTTSGKLKDAIYDIPWECMNTKNRKIVAFFLMNAQEPIHVKAMGVANVGVTSMATILKTSMSYFTFLRSM